MSTGNATVLAQNVPILREVCQLTGGRFNPEPPSLFVPDGLQLWPALVVLTALLFLRDRNPRRHRGVYDRIKSAFVNAGGRGNRDGFGRGISFPYRRQHPH
jgi:hypothetical protein